MGNDRKHQEMTKKSVLRSIRIVYNCFGAGFPPLEVLTNILF